MDVLRPPTIWIGNRCYRKNTTDDDEDSLQEEESRHRPLVEDDMYEDEVCDAGVDIEETDTGFRLRLDIPSDYFKFIIGKKGETKRRLENETGTQIKIPKQGMEGEIVVSGHDRKGVVSANTRIDVLVDSARQRQPFTHFLSFPVNLLPVRDRFLEFKDDVLRSCEMDRGLDGSIFQNPNKLHITLGTLALQGEREVERAAELLHECGRDLVAGAVEGRPLLAHLTGLEYMNDDPGEVDVLYAKVQLQDGSDRLQALADSLVDRFTQTRLMQRDFDRVKLHVTVMNTLFRQEASGAASHQGRQKQRESFDATGVLKNFGSYDFGVLCIEEVQLSQRYSVGKDGYYRSAGVLALPLSR